jgi:Putative adhesin
MRYSLAPFAIVAALTAVSSSARAQNDEYDGPSQYDSSFVTRQSIAAGGTIRIENLNGSINVDASDNATTTVTAVKRWRRGDPKQVRIVVEPGKNGATVCALWGDEQNCDDHESNNRHHNNHNDVSVQFTVRVAKGVKVDANTVNGSLDIRGATARVDAETVNGRVVVATLGGPVVAKTVNGSVRATIDHLVNSSEPLELESVNGSVQLEAPAELNGVLDAETTNGGIETDFPITINSMRERKHIHGTIGSGGRPLEMHTVNGSVVLKKLG